MSEITLGSVIESTALINDEFVKIKCNCSDDVEYLDFRSVTPFNGEYQYILNWHKDSSDVRISVENENLRPMLVGVEMAYHKFQQSNHKYFNLTGLQNIKALQHSSCSESSILFEFVQKAEKDFMFVLFGINPSVQLDIKAWDAYNTPLDLATWKTVDQGLLSEEGMNSNLLSITRPNAERSKDSKPLGSIKLEVDKNSFHGYLILRPNVRVAKMRVHVKNNCVPPKCDMVTLYYSLLALSCEGTSTTKPPVVTFPPTNPPTTNSSNGGNNVDPAGKFTIYGQIVNDTLRDGILELDKDKPFEGLVVSLFTTKSSLIPVMTTLTNATGQFQFKDLPSEEYRLRDGTTSIYLNPENPAIRRNNRNAVKPFIIFETSCNLALKIAVRLGSWLIDQKMDAFERIEQNYQQACNTVTRRIKQLPNFNGERKKEAVREAEHDIEEASTYINDMERVASNHPQRIRLQQKIKQYQADIQRFRREVSKAATTSNDYNRDNGFSSAPEDYQSQYDNQRQHLLQGYETVNQTSDRLMRASQISAQSEVIGEAILTDLGHQGQQIRGMKKKLDETDANVSVANRVIGSMARRVATNKVILSFIIILLLGIIVLIICLKWLRTK
ncbi:v-SNARE family protein [Heterostelium album PN500]|uniref:V-SNARE family protein n=1 Tax=Heterostelium pallidum (strain ATCC 26659 / Pp 5 / PN500) TaxID=670386 RepID=D3B5A8_HETP5|nr:v-SNARE family protein [Heterostelium album PN500]EFA83473.1 v-SNARE family protein [Heterostelium album PN500]|eukprot:XP_020435590.1 v-SNARE family protein [Heterostelium album PN500]